MCKNKLCSAVLLIAAVIGILAYVLFQNEVIKVNSTLFFLITAAAAFLFGLLVLGITGAQRTKALQKGFCCCGNLAVIGGAGSVLLSILLSAFYSFSTSLAKTAIALDFFCLTLLLGGIWCFLFEYMSCRRNVFCQCQDSYRINAACQDMENNFQEPHRDPMDE